MAPRGFAPLAFCLAAAVAVPPQGERGRSPESPLLASSDAEPDGVEPPSSLPTWWSDTARGLLVVPAHKLIVCPMSGAEPWLLTNVAKDLQCESRRKAGKTSSCNFWTEPRPSPTSEKTLLEAFKDPSWTKAVIFRDPLDRFLERYLAECVGAGGDGGEGCRSVFGGANVSMKHALTVMGNRSTVQGAMGAEPFKLQRELCLGTLQGHARDHYNYAAQMTAQNVRRVVGNLLRRVGVPEPEGLASFRHHLPPQDEAQAALNAVTGHQRTTQHLMRRTTVRLLLRLYADDYDAFGMRVPSWAARAAGSDWLSERNLSVQTSKQTNWLDTLSLTSNTSAAPAPFTQRQEGGTMCRWISRHDHCRCDADGKANCTWGPFDGQKPPASAPRPATMDGDAKCADTVSYLFFVGAEGIPTSSAEAWSAYFDTCPQGSFTVHVHEQKNGERNGTETDVTASQGLGTHVTSLCDPVEGELRYSWRMQEAALRLYEAGLGAPTESGCTPAWYHLVSVSTVPLASCDAVHQRLMTEPSSMLQTRVCEPDECSCDENRPPSLLEASTFYKSSQWSTLRRSDVEFLVDPALHEDRVNDWQDAFIPDEHFAVNELHRAGRHFALGDLTKVSNMTCSGHPMTFHCADDVEIDRYRRFVAGAKAEGKLFARKLGPRCAQLTLESWQAEHEDRADKHDA